MTKQEYLDSLPFHRKASFESEISDYKYLGIEYVN